MNAVFAESGKQFYVQAGDVVRLDYREANPGDTVEFATVEGGSPLQPDLELDAEDFAAYDEIEDDTATPGFVDEAATPGAAVPIAAAAAAVPVIPGLTTKGPRQMTLQHGDEAIATKPAAAAAAGDPGARLGRNDPCYCGSGLKYKKCHGK